MTAAVVNYFERQGVRVMCRSRQSAYTKNWEKALGSNPTQLGINAANARETTQCGIEMIMKKSSNPNLTGADVR